MVARGLGVRTPVALLACVAMAGCESTGGRAADYLSPPVRVGVDRLKAEWAQELTSQENVEERVRLMWEWSNALSMTGAPLNPDLPAIVAGVLNPDVDSVGARVLATVDMLINELRIRDENPPSAFGTLSSDAASPCVAGSHQTIHLTYVVGDIPIQPGGGLLVGRHFQSYPFPDGTNFQTHRPDGEGYVSVDISRGGTSLEPDTLMWYGLHGRAEVGTMPPVFRVVGSPLVGGDTIAITYGDTTSGSKGVRIQDYSNDAVPLPLYVDFDGSDNFVTLPLQTYQVAGQSVFAVHGFAPSTVDAGLPFTLSVRSEDRYLNKASGPIPAYEVRLNGEAFRTIPSGDSAITAIEGIRLDDPGVYRFTFRSPDGAVTGQSNPVWVRTDPAWHVYWGDTHGHSGFAEGLGTPDGYYRFGRDESRLDFITHSEHDVWLDDREWETLRENVRRYHAEGEFIAFLGYEWTVNRRRGGHHNVLFRTPDGRDRVPLQTAPVQSELYRRLAEENELDDVLIIPHAHQPGDWRASHSEMERLVEVMSGHGNFEWYGRRYLGLGRGVGFIAASDDHFSHPGYSAPFLYGYTQRSGLAAVLAPEKTSDAIFDALRGRRTYGTTGQRMILDVNLNGSPMGTRAEFDSTRRVAGRVIGTAPIDKITLVKNGQDLETRDLLTAPAGSSDRFEVVFWSDSDPRVFDVPRGWRRWEGSLRLRGAELGSFSTPSIQNRVLQSVTVREDDRSVLDFVVMTRGSEKSIILELKDVRPDATLELTMHAAPEAVRAFYARIAYAEPRHLISLPGRASFALRDLESGTVSRVFPDDPFRDTVSLRRIRENASLEREFEFVDSAEPLPGDNYYVRVTQLDDGVAWSSPIWVGGFAQP